MEGKKRRASPKPYWTICKFCGYEYIAKSGNAKFCERPNCVKKRKETEKILRRLGYKLYYKEHKKERLEQNKNNFTGVKKENELNKTYKRKCLKCDKAFKTKNKLIRICSKCKMSTSWANTLTEEDFSNGINFFKTKHGNMG